MAKKKDPKTEEATQQDFYVGVVERPNTYGITEEKIHEKLGDIHKNKVQRLTDEEKEIIKRWNEWGLKDVPQNWRDVLAGKPSPTPTPSDGSTTTTPILPVGKTPWDSFAYLLYAKFLINPNVSIDYDEFSLFLSKTISEERTQIETLFFISLQNMNLLALKLQKK